MISECRVQGGRNELKRSGKYGYGELFEKVRMIVVEPIRYTAACNSRNW